MGRPRALKQKDKNLKDVKIDISAKNDKKSLYFDEEEENQLEEVVEAPKQSYEFTDQKNIEKMDDESPEEVKAESYEILQLKKVLEESVMASKVSKLKRKRNIRPAVSRNEGEVLDTSIFQEESDPIKVVEEVPKITIVSELSTRNNHVRNFGMLEVRLANSDDFYDPVKKFKISKEVSEFAKLKSSTLKRTKYQSFISQRRAKPSHSFTCK